MTSAWDFARSAWARAGVSEACLILQDEQGQCPALLLWRLWTLATGRSLDKAEVTLAAGAARGWHDAVILPLREARRAAKVDFGVVEPVARVALRERILAAELAAEHSLIDGLQRLSPPIDTSSRDHPATRALVDLSAAWGRPVSAEVFAALIAAMESDATLTEGGGGSKS